MEQLEFHFGSIHWDMYLNSLFMQIINNQIFEQESILKCRKVGAIIHNCEHLPQEFQIYLHRSYAHGYHVLSTQMEHIISGYPLNIVVVIFVDGRSPGAFWFNFPP